MKLGIHEVNNQYHYRLAIQTEVNTFTQYKMKRAICT